MSIDVLQNQIRKRKNPSIIAFVPDKAQIPSAFLQSESSALKAYDNYVKALLKELKDTVPAVRFGFGTFAICGAEGIAVLQDLLTVAKDLGYYVLLDLPEITSVQEATVISEAVFDDSLWTFDGLTASCYIGTDAIRSILEKMEDNDKDLFLLLRTGNKSAQELQDLLTGSRLVYTAAADIAKRVGQQLIGRSGFSRVAGVGPATSPDSLQTLRSKYPEMFLFVDGYDYSGANAKNCSVAFDRLGHGAIVCAGNSVVGAWKKEAETDPLVAAVSAAEKMKKNLTRYVTIL